MKNASELTFKRNETYGIFNNKVVSQAMEDIKKRGKKLKRKIVGRKRRLDTSSINPIKMEICWKKKIFK
jgi:hypothetical protein